MGLGLQRLRPHFPVANPSPILPHDKRGSTIITTDSPIYQKAFEQYLRKGTTIERSLKMLTRTETRENHSTVLYRWRTSGDDKVRTSHAANNGQIFLWNKPPPTCHLGE